VKILYNSKNPTGPEHIRVTLPRIKAEVPLFIMFRALGVISDKIDPKNCWIILEDAKKADVIRIGDMIKMKYSKSSMKSFAKMAKNMTK
jgi:hypothetical protein